MNAARLIAAKDVRLLLRNRTIYILGFLAPLGLALVLNVVFGGIDEDVTFKVGLADEDGGAVAGGFAAGVDDLADAGLLEVTAYGDAAAARSAVDDGDVSAAWVLPPGFSAAVTGGQGAEILVVGDVDAEITASVARAVADGFAARIGTGALAGLVVADTGVVPPEEIPAVVESTAQAPARARLVPAEVASTLLDRTTSLTAGLALFFAFFTAGIPMLSILEERAGGTLARLLVAPIPSSSVLAGKVLAALVLGATSLVSLILASSALMGADWGPLPGAFLVAGAAVVAISGVMAVAASVARSAEQAGNLQSIVAVVLGVLGGTFVPISGSEAGLLGTLQGLTPNGWFLDGLEAARADGPGAALPAIAVLLAIGLATGAVGLRLAGRGLRR